jgi:hypothetical protein
MFSPPKIQRQVFSRPLAFFTPLQEWEGYVVAVTPTHVVANLVDITAEGRRPSERAEIPLTEFADEDIPKLTAGKVFRWAIGYQRLSTGTKMRGSQIVVRDLPIWTTRELTAAKKEAEDLHRFLSETPETTGEK